MKVSSGVASSKSDIAAVAYRLWLGRGCPVGSSQEDWFLAELAIECAFVAKCEELFGGLSISSCGTRTDPETLVECEWEGHWEVWEREWSGAHWVSDLPAPAFLESHSANRIRARL